MKHVPCLRWVGNFALGALLFAVPAFSPLSAENSAPTLQNDLRQNTSDQTDVREHTAAVVTQVQGLIDELAANGISGDDAKVLQATKAALANLSGPEIDRVIASLKKAESANNAADASNNAVTAYTAQKGIVLQFRMILKEYEQREAAYALAARFKELTARQTDTVRTTEQVARDTAGMDLHQLTTTQQTTQAIVQADQDAIVNEAAIAQDQLVKAASDGSGDDAKPLLQARNDMNNAQMQVVLAQANDDLKAGHFLKAITGQTAARDILRRIAQDLIPPANEAEKIAETATDLAKLIEEQKQLLGQTNSSMSAKVLAGGLNDQQGVLVDEATLVQKDTLTLSAPAADLVNDAINPPMQTSRAQLGDLNGLPAAASAQGVAIAKLEAAQKLLQRELAEAEQKEKDANVAKDNAPAPDLGPLTNAATELNTAQSNVSTAMTAANTPPSTPPQGTPPQPGTTPPTPNPPGSDPSANNPPPNNPPDNTPGTPPPSPTMGEALKALTDAGTNVDNVANTPGLPDDTKNAVTEAKTDIEQGKTAAANGDAAGTMAAAGAAQGALTRAQATLALAMAGMSGAPNPNAPPSPMPTPPGPDVAGPAATHLGPGSNEKPAQHAVADTDEKIIALQNRIRVAFAQSGVEKRPQEYAPLIDQYLKNLADESSMQ